MAKSVKFADDAFVEDARAVSEVQSRSLAGQITHWARIGRAIERSSTFDHTKISRVLSGAFDTTILSAEEKSIWSEQFVTKMSEPGPSEEAFFSDLRKSGKAVGLGASGQIVYAEVPPKG